MTNPAVWNEIKIDRDCSAAICEEIGDRLRISLQREPERLPQHVTMLVEQMEQNDYVSTVLSNKSEIAAKFIQTAENQLVMQRLNQNAEVAI